VVTHHSEPSLDTAAYRRALAQLANLPKPDNTYQISGNGKKLLRSYYTKLNANKRV